MQLITCQPTVGVQKVLEKVGHKHRVTLNLLSPNVGIVVDGHHHYFASLIDHKTVEIVTAGNWLSDGNYGEGLVGYWAERMEHSDKWSCWYDLSTGKGISPKWLQKLCRDWSDFKI